MLTWCSRNAGISVDDARPAEKLDTDRDSGWSVDEAALIAERPRLRTHSMDPRGSYEPAAPKETRSQQNTAVGAGDVPREITEAHVSGWMMKMGSKFPFNWQDRLFAFNSDTKMLYYYALQVVNGQVRWGWPPPLGRGVVKGTAALPPPAGVRPLHPTPTRIRSPLEPRLRQICTRSASCCAARRR